MNEFFRQQLSKLHLAGIRQVEFITKEEIDELVDMLCAISEKNFGYIPKNIQQAEIQKQIVQDPDLNKDGGITTRWLFKTLSRIAEPYWKIKIKQDNEEEIKGEPISPERAEYWIGEWNKVISKANENFTRGKGTGSQIRESLDQLATGVDKRFIVGEVCPRCNGDAVIPTGDELIGEELIKCLTCNGTGEVNRKEVWAKDEEEAKAKYDA